MGSAGGVLSRGSRPMVPLKVSDLGDRFLTVGEKTRSKGLSISPRVSRSTYASML